MCLEVERYRRLSAEIEKEKTRGVRGRRMASRVHFDLHQSRSVPQPPVPVKYKKQSVPGRATTWPLRVLLQTRDESRLSSRGLASPFGMFRALHYCIRHIEKMPA